MKKGLVLAGGGSKGAYHIGALIALQEMGYVPDLVTGTSIGALIGCMVAEKKTEEVVALWKRLTVEDVIAQGVSLNINMEEMFERKKDVLRFFKQTLKEKGVNIDPLKKMIENSLDFDALQASEIDFGLVTYMISQNRPVMITKKEMTRENCGSYLLASASCFPVFPVCSFEGEDYVDGGYADNLPIELAIQMGAEELIVVDLNSRIQHPEFFGRPNILYLRPQEDLGSFLDFERDELDRRITLGYFDMLKGWKRLVGVRCTFNPQQIDPALMRQFYWRLLEWEMELNRGKVRKSLNPFSAQPATSALKNYARQAMMEETEYGETALDLLVDLLLCPSAWTILDAKACLNECCQYYQAHLEELLEIIQQIKQMKLPALRRLFEKISEKELIIVLARLLREETAKNSLLLLMGIFSREFCAALMLCLALEENR